MSGCHSLSRLSSIPLRGWTTLCLSTRPPFESQKASCFGTAGLSLLWPPVPGMIWAALGRLHTLDSQSCVSPSLLGCPPRPPLPSRCHPPLPAFLLLPPGRLAIPASPRSPSPDTSSFSNTRMTTSVLPAAAPPRLPRPGQVWTSAPSPLKLCLSSIPPHARRLDPSPGALPPCLKFPFLTHLSAGIRVQVTFPDLPTRPPPPGRVSVFLLWLLEGRGFWNSSCPTVCWWHLFVVQALDHLNPGWCLPTPATCHLPPGQVCRGTCG